MVANYTQNAVLGDDTGLCVEALGGAPGVMSARYAGDHDNAKNRAKLLCELQNATNRNAHFETVVALRYTEGKIVTAFGRVDGLIATEADALKMAKKLGYPVIVKATAGGGGRGMRIAHDEAGLIQGFHAAKTEAENAFGDGSLYMEKYIINPRHIEFQILADEHGNVVHLGERDCSVQRRNQKLIEESPSPALNSKLREKMGSAAVKAAKAAGYTNAGTIEFLLTQEGNFYFMEMNTRVQVEHPVTEELTGVDIVKEQIRIAAGEPLSFRQKDIKFEGHVIECRINAENPDTKFTPCPGEVKLLVPAGGIGVRVDTHVYSGYRIPPYYDSMIAKLIVKAADREQAIIRCRRALDEFIVDGVKTTIPLSKKIVCDKDFTAGNYDTGFVERAFMSDGAKPAEKA